jgi:hypothetical protein
MTIPLVDIQEDTTGRCVFIGWIQQDKVIAFGLNNGICIAILPYHWLMYKRIQEDPTGICVSIECIQHDKVIAFRFNNGIWIGT